MEQYLTVKEVAALKGCSDRYIRRLIVEKGLSSSIMQKDQNFKRYLIPLSALPPKLQAKYYRETCGEVPEHLRKTPKEPVREKPLEEFSAAQREEIDRWITILTDWQSFRTGYNAKAQADEAFLAECPKRYGEHHSVSKDKLYRRWAAYRAKDWDGLIDKRGQWRKGKSDTPQEIRDAFEYCYLDETALTVAKCMEATRLHLKQKAPALLDSFPAYDTFYRWSKQLPAPIATLARKGDKAFNDEYGIFVDRLYDDMASNDYWIADGHRIDVITKSEDGKEQTRRLTLSAFIDARSGIYVGWVVTDNPSSDATLFALRKAIQQYGIPRYIYVDNGREYLNIDIGGMGHRTRHHKVEIKLPTPVLSRLGIQMTNALPTNAQAKIIEREFKNFTFLAQLFETYCGNSVVTKPEKLKDKLKVGKIPTDGQLTQVVEDMIEGYFNLSEYNGKVVADRGLTRLEVYRRHLSAVRMAAPEDLHLMMLRSTRLQTIGRNGVHIIIGGEKIYYFDDELLMMQGNKAFVRYDPENLDEVRVYDEDEVFIKTAPLRLDMMLTYTATKEEISRAMAEKRRWRRLAKEGVDIRREVIVSRYGHLNMLDIFVRAARENREGILAGGRPKVVEIVTAPERTQPAADGTSGEPVLIDRLKMIQNSERRA